MTEIYFAKKNNFNKDEINELKNCSYVRRLYTASSSNGYFLLGVASEDGQLIPRHNGSERFNIPIKDVLFDYNGKPFYISVMWLNTVRNPDKIMEAFEKWKKDGGLCRHRILDKKIYLGPPYKSKLIRTALSDRLDREFYYYNQALVLEFDTQYKSSQVVAKLARNDIEKIGSCVSNENNFSILNKIK